MQYSNESIIAAVLGTFFATLVFTSVAAFGLSYWFLVKMKKIYLDSGGGGFHDGEKADAILFPFCTSHSKQISLQFSDDQQMVSANLPDNLLTTAQDLFLRSIEFSLEDSNPEDLKQLLSSVGKFQITLKMLRSEIGKNKFNQNGVQPKVVAAENPGVGSESSKFKVEHEIDAVDDKSSRVSSRANLNNRRPFRRQCRVCDQLSLDDKGNSEKLVNRQRRTPKEDILSNNDVSSSNNTQLSTDSMATATGIRTSVDISYDKHNKDIEIDIDPVELTSDDHNHIIMESVSSLKSDLQEAGFKTVWEELNLSPTFELAGQWRDPANEKEGMIREKSTKGGVSYYVNVETGHEIFLK